MNRRSFLKSMLGVLAAASVPVVGIRYAEAKSEIEVDTEADKALPVAKLVKGTWNNIAMVRKGNDLRLYLNGEQVADILGVSVSREGQILSFDLENNPSKNPVFQYVVQDDVLGNSFTFESWVKVEGAESEKPALYLDELRLTGMPLSENEIKARSIQSDTGRGPTR